MKITGNVERIGEKAFKECTNLKFAKVLKDTSLEYLALEYKVMMPIVKIFEDYVVSFIPHCIRKRDVEFCILTACILLVVGVLKCVLF